MRCNPITAMDFSLNVCLPSLQPGEMGPSFPVLHRGLWELVVEMLLDTRPSSHHLVLLGQPSPLFSHTRQLSYRHTSFSSSMDFAPSSLRYSAIPEESESFLDENQRFLADSKEASFPLDYGARRRGVWRFLSQTWVLYCNLVLLTCCLVLLGTSIHPASRDSDSGRNAMLKKNFVLL
jgi:hypothetical protein